MEVLEIIKKIADKKTFHRNGGEQSAIVITKDTIANYTVQKPVNKKEISIDKKKFATKENAAVKKDEIEKSYYSIKQKLQFKKADKKSENIIKTAGAKNIIVEKYTQEKSSSNLDLDKLQSSSEVNFQLHKTVNKDSILSVTELDLATLNPLNIPAPQLVAQADAALINKADTQVIASIKKQPAKTKIKSKKAEWSLLFSAGSSTLNGGISNDEKALSSSNQNSPVLSGPVLGNTTNTGSFIRPNAGISFSAGIARKYVINKHWSWQVALNYGLLTSKQSTGRKNDTLSSSNFFADAYSRTLSFSSATSIYTNRVHRLQIVPRISYTFNPSANSPVQFFAGASLAYHLSNNILLHDYRTGYYIRSTSLSNNLMLGGMAGFDVFINKKINAGLFFQHDFTNIADSKIGSSFHWNQLQLSVGIPLSKHK